jgi:hypothetical protein
VINSSPDGWGILNTPCSSASSSSRKMKDLRSHYVDLDRSPSFLLGFAILQFVLGRDSGLGLHRLKPCVLILPDLGLREFGTPYPLRNLLPGSCILNVSLVRVPLDTAESDGTLRAGKGENESRRERHTKGNTSQTSPPHHLAPRMRNRDIIPNHD